MEFKVEIDLYCSECGEELKLDYRNFRYLVDLCPKCIQSAKELADEEGYERGISEIKRCLE